LVDRPFTAGDTVYKYDGDKPSRIGYCESVNVSSTVRVINTSRIIENVCGEELNSKNVCIFNFIKYLNEPNVNKYILFVLQRSIILHFQTLSYNFILYSVLTVMIINRFLYFI